MMTNGVANIEHGLTSICEESNTSNRLKNAWTLAPLSDAVVLPEARPKKDAHGMDVKVALAKPNRGIQINR